MTRLVSPSTARPLSRVTLETSLKPFPAFDPDTVRRTTVEIFRQWRPLLGTADSCSVLLWIGDGSEILDWAGDPGATVEWARWIGFNNTAAAPYGEKKDPERVAVPYLATEPSRLTYADVARVVRVLREVGNDLGLRTTVGATFDPGPEFAPSDFKYVRHPEVVARGEDVGVGPIIQMIRHFSVLRGDDRSYAAFPRGIPDGTHFGTFLGRQAQAYLEAHGFDYLWLSNGFGFTAYPWAEVGETFDGDRFRPERSGELRRRALDFWEKLAHELDFPVEVRGTNHSAGIDIGADSVPALEIYERGLVAGPPPNSPWGPLNEEFGVELAGFMSRVCLLPTGSAGYRFRFYANDPWFWQQPWRDFYGRHPFDIYLPLAVSRVRSDGSVQGPSEVNVLSVDTAHGVLDERTGREVGGHVVTALESGPDEPGPLVWVYPFREYHDDMARDPTTIGRPFFEDWYLAAAIDAGLPLSTVVSTDDAVAAHASGALAGRILVVPAGALTDGVVQVLSRHLADGGHLVAYGSLARCGDAGRELLGIEMADGIAGDLVLRSSLAGDVVLTGAVPTRIRHVADLSDGPVRERAVGTGVRVLADVGVETDSPGGSGLDRAYATARTVDGGGTALWVRGSSPFAYRAPDERGARRRTPHDRDRFTDTACLLRDVLGEVGMRFGHELRTSTSGRIVQGVHRHRGAYWFSGYVPDTTTRLRLALPDGAPLLTHSEAWLDGGGATYQLPKSYHLECRALARQEATGRVRCREIAPVPAHMTRSLEIDGLVDAELLLLLPSGVADGARVAINGVRVLDAGAILVREPDSPASCTLDRSAVRLAGVTGSVIVAWPEGRPTPADVLVRTREGRE